MLGTINAKSLRAALAAATALGLDARALASAWEVAEAVTNADARFPHAAWIGLWQDIIRRTGSESIGIDAAEAAVGALRCHCGARAID